ncbi:MAG: hypothetical protein ACP5RH_19850 [Leptodesmis sp.]|uniref:hypothetical protein n=1 Tax=Leptodesmis sp. TaxID=3100501 RepID=UPI003D1498BA
MTLEAIDLMTPLVSVTAAWDLIALFIAVFPANIHQALHSIPIEGIPHHPILHWDRLPFEAVLIIWIW